MLTDKYYENLFTQPIVLNEKESDAFIKALKDSYRKERRKNIAEVVQNVLMKTGNVSISKSDKELVRICYKTAYTHSFTKNFLPVTPRTMWKSIYCALKRSPMFHRIPIGMREYKFVLSPAGFNCKERVGNHCNINNCSCDTCNFNDCAFFIVHYQKFKKK